MTLSMNWSEAPPGECRCMGTAKSITAHLWNLSVWLQSLHGGHPPLRNNWKSQHSVDELELRHLHVHGTGCWYSGLHDHKDVNRHHDLAPGSVAPELSPVTVPSIYLPPQAGGEFLRGKPLDVTCALSSTSRSSATK